MMGLARKWGILSILLVSEMAASCFSSEILTGSPCSGSGQCGDELECLAGFCQPDACADDPECAPFQKPCMKDDPEAVCTAVGASGCFFADAEPAAGYCALTCDESTQCPDGADGTAQPACVAVDSTVKVCGLDCAGDLVCPSDMHCADVTFDGTSRALCLSGASPAE